MGCEPRSQSDPEKVKTEFRKVFVSDLPNSTNSPSAFRWPGERLLDARALLHALEMRRGYCISANFVESSSSVHHRLW